MSELARVYPVLVERSQIAHLATTVLDEDGDELLYAGYRVICPGGPMITSPVRLIADGEPFVWCPSCREWADAAAISLPLSP